MALSEARRPSCVVVRCPRCRSAYIFVRPSGPSLEVEAYDLYCWALTLSERRRRDLGGEAEPTAH